MTTSHPDRWRWLAAVLMAVGLALQAYNLGVTRERERWRPNATAARDLLRECAAALTSRR